MKSYGQLCGVARALDMVGDRWTLLILRDLLLGPLHYGELLANLEGITTNLLANRLKDLMNKKLVQRLSPGRHAEYALTDMGRSIEPVLFALGQWGGQFTDFKAPNFRRNFRWAMVSTRRRMHPVGQDYQLLIIPHNAGAYTIFEHRGRLGVETRETAVPDATVKGAPMAIAEALIQKQTADTLGQNLKITGDTLVWDRFITALGPF